MKQGLLISFFLLISYVGFSQSYTIFDKKAIKLHQEGDELIQKRMYDEAIEKFKASINREANFLESYLKWGRILLTQGFPDQAIEIADRGLRRNIKGSSNLFGEIAWLKTHSHLKLGDFEAAILEFEQAQMLLNVDFKKTRPFKEIEEQINFIKVELENSYDINKQKLAEPLNQFVLQYFPVLTADSKKMLFTKRNGLENYEHEDIFVSYYDEDSLKWGSPRSIASNINSAYNEGTCTISADGKILIFTSCQMPDSFGDCDLYISYKVNDEWQRPINMGKNVNSRVWDSQPSLSADGRILFFSSNRRGGFGGKDIWFSLRMADGSWSEAKNLGEKVNTSKDEVSPFIYFNNEILFFASEGHVGFGGLDLFISRVVSGDFGDPVNLGFPINDHQDQLALFITAQRDYAYYTETVFNNGVQERSFLYKFKFPDQIDLGERLMVTEGKVLNKNTGEPIKAKLSLVDLVTDSTLYQFESDGRTGEFTMLYPDKPASGLYVEKQGYLPKIYNVDRDSLQNKKNLDVELIPVGAGEEFIFENIFFDFDKDDLKPESRSSLRRLISFMNDNPSVEILIAGHTDNVGSEVYNKDLSLRRAESVKEFLILNGIIEGRLGTKGFGSAKPVSNNDTSENRALNRRITISIL
ncbi:outer membrane protein/peptidoglycan-associated (lipo)protein [Belliella baltica DSM 15883]|uniref:Outer membrane protein/peptidoglycan-associated (Lipo)protein n=1 Tax=Belliella baltica (strain DSM 15883 / CIP 108006 / LMG 21964 / BA134) TaxID=866536 RepID=I3Z0Z1_BELBD|nr:OmpA family protein [Belliella baltica]AFL82909.1 outer membrane protein/peptidoglycan-associated (lipo)protein [Belliella baltica DSM 15883]